MLGLNGGGVFAFKDPDWGESSAPKGPWRTARSSAAASTAKDIDPHATRTVMLAIATAMRMH